MLGRWENGDFGKSVTTASIDNGLYSAIQNRAIREAKADHSKDGAVRYRESQPFAVNNQNWEIDTTENGTVVIGFPCVSQWWYTPIEGILDTIESNDIHAVVMGTTGRRGTDRILLGSVAEKTVRSAPVPVITVGRGE